MSKAKVVTATIRLVIPAGQAKPSPPVGPALGQAGLKIMDFCKDFNAKTADFKSDVPVPVVITAFADKSFKWVMKTPPASYFIKKAAGMDSGSQRPGHQHVAAISLKHLHEIALVKQQDQPMVGLPSLVKSLMGTARSMGVRVVTRPEDAP
ncbi:mitochondrial ribosomal L11 [Micractinium conductrix]|uniref:Large ribosomal subunit protein uL11m n=1 Tax=Micractinium conductrix TaxID=554055 RepID=A0A2P6VMY2_9CHLO|nr:mitochondrial ribosomal L11 [Micractinium conductrix]|eukprot:PSC75443.1 mitochondrial ribosomal L11 [Micractinium conductrix]